VTGRLQALDAGVIREVVKRALEEDLGGRGDITAVAAVPIDLVARARIVARSELVLSGIDVARAVFVSLDETIDVRSAASDGSRLTAGTTVATLVGPAQPILAGERTALNFLMRMSGIATATAEAVREIAGSGARILDTRKTAPGLRRLDKYAVACGGGVNHRMGLYDAAMFKDTHQDAGGRIGDSVRAALDNGCPREAITVEARSAVQVDEAIAAGAGRVLLDNMDLDSIREAVRRSGGRVVLEVSGGLRHGRLREIADTGVDFLSLGCLTHSSPAADLALEMDCPR
jgi:nicotinate-nucleotide pyrophosphorylase (carboxylating)